MNFITDENTRSKFLFYGGPDCIHMKDGLEVYIDSEVIPDFLGGPCSVSNFILIMYSILNNKHLYKSIKRKHNFDYLLICILNRYTLKLIFNLAKLTNYPGYGIAKILRLLLLKSMSLCKI